MQCPSLTAGACVASRRRALHASGAPPWRRPASAAALVAAWASTAALPALFARCFGRIGVELERAHAHASRCSLTSRYKILNTQPLSAHLLLSPGRVVPAPRPSTASKRAPLRRSATPAAARAAPSSRPSTRRAFTSLLTRSPHHLPPTLLSIPWSYIGPIPISSLTSY